MAVAAVCHDDDDGDDDDDDFHRLTVTVGVLRVLSILLPSSSSVHRQTNL
jgi:hypothetical protein